jgi:hypothetical protein
MKMLNNRINIYFEEKSIYEQYYFEEDEDIS